LLWICVIVVKLQLVAHLCTISGHSKKGQQLLNTEIYSSTLLQLGLGIHNECTRQQALAMMT